MNKVKSIIQLNLSSILRNLFGLIRSKITALLLGIEGIGVLGQVITFFNVQNKIVSFGTDTIIVNRLAKLNEATDKENHDSIVIFSFIFLLLTNLVYITVTLIFNDRLTILLFDDIKFKYITGLIIIVGPLFAISHNFEVLTQSKAKFTYLAIGRNFGSILAILLVFPLIFYFHYWGIVLSLYVFVLGSGLYFFFINWDFLKRIKLYNIKNIYTNINFLLKLGLTDIVRKLLFFLSLLIFRIIIVQKSGIKVNGLFQAAWSISAYTEIFIAAFISFYFPVISNAQNGQTIKKKIQNNLNALIYIIFPIIALIMLLSDFLLFFLYNEAFLQMELSLRILAYSRFFQAIYLFYLITLLSQSKLKEFLMGETIRSFSLVISAYILVPMYSLHGAIISTVISQVLPLLSVFIMIMKMNDFLPSVKEYKLFFRVSILLFILLIPYDNNWVFRGILAILFISLTFLIIDLNKYKNIIISYLGRK
ncbi:MAG: hypothetical protein GF313_09530 [Caldithrix sp.]|nr:hypothetical protein [Caldithrix sp.]